MQFLIYFSCLFPARYEASLGLKAVAPLFSDHLSVSSGSLMRFCAEPVGLELRVLIGHVSKAFKTLGLCTHHCFSKLRPQF